MSGGLAPSKSTVYIGNLPFSLTNNDLHKVLEKHGKVVKVTIVKDRITKRSKGVAFVLFLERDSAHKCVHAMNQTQMFGRTVKCSIAKDNGRAPEFIRRKEYKDKSDCYECGELGHMSYNCPKNLLGDREPPPKKIRKRKKEDGDDTNVWSDEEEEVEEIWSKKRGKVEEEKDEDDDNGSDEGEDPRLDTLASVVKDEQEKIEVEEYRVKVATGQYDAIAEASDDRKKKYKKDAYFSDEEELDDD